MILLNDLPMQFGFIGLQSNIQKGCLLLIPLFMLIKMGIILMKGFVSSHPMNYQSFYGGILLWVFIATYGTVIQNVSGLASYIVELVSKPIENPILAVSLSMEEAKVFQAVNFGKNMDNSISKIKSGEILKGIQEVGATTFGAMVENVTQSGRDFLASIVAIFASLARSFIETVRAILLKFLIIIGPLAMTLSINEGFGHIWKFWLQKFFAVYCWSLTLNILDHLIIDYYHQVAVMPVLNQFLGQKSGSPETPYFMDQLIVGLMYTMVPWLTSLYLGGFNSNHFLTNNFRMFTSLVTTALSSAHSVIQKK
jgi:hypothetical protein